MTDNNLKFSFSFCDEFGSLYWNECQGKTKKYLAWVRKDF